MGKFSQSERERYQKHILLNDVGEAGQMKLNRASICVIGAGGLGSPVLLYLAAAGVGKLIVVDDDMVSLSNLQRQVIHETASIKKLKVLSASERLKKINPDVEVVAIPLRLTRDNSSDLIASSDVVMDCTDNLETRFFINDMCVKFHKPMVYGAVFHYEGQVSIFDADRGPCFRCMYPVIPNPELIPDPAVNGLLTTVPGVIGLLQANEAIKLILDIGTPFYGMLLLVDLLGGNFKQIQIKKNPDCPVCGKSTPVEREK